MILDWHCADGAEVPHVSVNDVTEGPDDEVCVAVFYPTVAEIEAARLAPYPRAMGPCEDRALLFIEALVVAGRAQRPDAAWQARWYPEESTS
jgi:hypothetical protein